MPLSPENRPEWLTFDCYGTLIQWDEGLQQVAAEIIARRGGTSDPADIVPLYDLYEGEAERNAPFKPFRQVAGTAFKAALRDLGVAAEDGDGDVLVDAIPGFVPFPETLRTLATLKAGGFRIALISNTDDDLIAGNVDQLGGHVDAVITGGAARSYKPSRLIFEYALARLGIDYDRMVHICASPGLDHAAARDQRFRCIWIDRGTYRKPLSDYTADETFPTLDGVVDLFGRLGWM